MDVDEEHVDDEEENVEHNNAAGDGHRIGKLDSDLDTEEEGDDEVGFEIACDDDDTASSD